MHLLASIPSPGSNAIHIGSLQLRAYGLMIALGVLAAVKVASDRFEKLGVGTADDMANIATWAVPTGVIGARAYHVITDWQLFRDDPMRMFKIWEGGLGIPGGLLVGLAVGAWRAKVRTGGIAPALTAVTPAIPLAQAIARVGNWWNQELFGTPTTLPWALEIDPEHRPERYANDATFHPAFLYESLWNLALFGFLLWVERRVHLRPGRLFCVYLMGYSFARFFIERIRVDPANTLAGLRVNEWMAIIVFSGAAGFLLLDRRKSSGAEPLDQLSL